MNPELEKLLDDGSQHGLSLSERLLVEQRLLDDGLSTELHNFRAQSKFLLAEQIMDSANVAGFRRTVGRGVDMGVIGRHVSNPTISAFNAPQPAKSLKQRKLKPIPPNADLKAFKKRYPTFKAVGLLRETTDCKAMIIATDERGCEMVLPVKLLKRIQPSFKISPKQPIPFSVASPTPKPLPQKTMTATEQWHASKAIQQEFPTAEIYDAFKRAEAQGRAKITTRLPASFNYPPERKAAIGMTPRVYSHREEWEHREDLRFEFPSAEVYEAFRKGTRTPSERAMERDTKLNSAYGKAKEAGHVHA